MADRLIKKPTYFKHIRHLFDETDLLHMFEKGFDLSTYTSLKEYDTKVLFSTEPGKGSMPMGKDKWSEERWETFKNWITTNPKHAIGTPEVFSPKPAKVKRLRRDVDDLDQGEIDLLITAFEGIMKLPRTDPNSYFALASIHWYPDKDRCEHHNDKYHPWHRAYLLRFENALRTISGCEDITLPFWDVTKPPPSFLFKKPFSFYTFPVDVSSDPKHKAGEKTIRNSRAAIVKRLKEFDVAGTISKGLAKPVWGNFNNYEEASVVAAHDNGHGAMGGSQLNSGVASFDPIFWFFHCYWDRLWWEWQMAVQATTYWKFRSTILDSTLFLDRGFDDLEPFGVTVRDVIDSHELDVGYSRPKKPLIASFEERSSGSLEASSRIRFSKEAKTSIRVKGINRMNIPGGFETILKADGKIVGRRYFFQSNNPKECATCEKLSQVNLDFEVPLKKVHGKSLDIEIHVLDTLPGLGTRFPLEAAGNPTINARIMLENE